MTTYFLPILHYFRVMKTGDNHLTRWNLSIDCVVVNYHYFHRNVLGPIKSREKLVTFGTVKFLLLHSRCIAAKSVSAVTGASEVFLPLDFLLSSLSALTVAINTNPAT